MQTESSHPLPPRAKELVESIKATLADPPPSPDARNAAVAKVETELAELIKLAKEASQPPDKVPGWVKWVLSQTVAAVLKGILDILLRTLPRFPRLTLNMV